MTASSGPSLSAEWPFPGLRPFCFADHEFFFGREDQIYALYRLLDVSRFIAVVGSSGSGKSSLLYAGLRPLLRKESREAGGRNWRWAELRPGDAPLSCLAEALAKLSPDGGGAADEAVSEARRERIAHALRRSSFGLAEALGEIAGLEGQTILLVVDQFEELFRYAGASAGGRRNPAGDARWRDEATHFVQLLLEAGRDRSHDVHVLLAMRSDFIGDCARFHGLPEAVSAAQYLVPSLTRDQREEVIRKPVEKAGATVEPALVERLLNDSGDELDQLPVLQHCLMRLWDRAGASRAEAASATPPAQDAEAGTAPGRHLTLEHYRAVGGIAAALSNHADEILAGLPGLEPTVEQTFRALAETDDDGRVTRRALRFARLLAETGVPEHALRRVLDRFRADDCSFLVPARSAVETLRPDTRVDVGHEALLRRWKRISAQPGETLEAGAQQGGWLWAEQQDRQRYRALLALATDPEATSGRVTLPLDQVEARWKWWTSRPRTEAWAERYGGGFARVQQLLEDSRVEAQQEKRRKNWAARLKAAAGVVTLISVLAIVVATYAWSKRNEALRAESKAVEAAKVAEENFHVTILSMFTTIDDLKEMLNNGGIPFEPARKIIENTSETVDRLRKTSRDADISVHMIQLTLILADIYLDLEDTKQARMRANVAKEIAETLWRKDPDKADAQHWRSEAYSRLGRVLAREHDWGGALENTSTALDIASQLATKYPENSDWQSSLAWQYVFYADVLQMRKDWDKALQANKAGLAIREQLASRDPMNTQWRRDIADSRAKNGELLTTKGDLDGAREEYLAALEIRQQLANADPYDVALEGKLATSHSRIGVVLAKKGDWAGAVREHRQAGEIRARLAAGDPTNAKYQSSLGHNHADVGEALAVLDDPDGALQAYRAALGIATPLANKFPSNLHFQKDLSNYHDKIADLLRKQGDLSGAVRDYRAALQVREKIAEILRKSGDGRKLLEWQAKQIESHGKIGDILKAHDPEGALKAYRDALALAEQLAKKDLADQADWHDKITELRRKIESLCGRMPAPATCSA